MDNPSKQAVPSDEPDPKPQDPVLDPDSEIDLIAKRHGSLTRQEIVRDIIWAYEYMGRKVHPRPPSKGAKALLLIARENPKWFIEKMLSKAIPSRLEPSKSEQEEIQDLRSQNNLIKRALEVSSECARIYAG